MELCFHMDVRTIRIIKASGQDRETRLPSRIAELVGAGFNILFEDIAADPAWPWTAGSVSDRAEALRQALLEDESDAIMWARGGYGASDLLPLIPWVDVVNAKPKPIIGFSDVCAAQSALYTHTGRISIHGPMPATETWGKNGRTDVDLLLSILNGKCLGSSQAVYPLDDRQSLIRGVLFGGCLSVLTSLIGTPYLPSKFLGNILFFEDVGENPGRVIRLLNQWQQAGLFDGVVALVLGRFTDLGAQTSEVSELDLRKFIAKRYGVPTFWTAEIGHVSPNMPLPIGVSATIESHVLSWSFSL